ncbi:MAG: hypothetical protein FWC24_02340 [Treponema sp.]|nr:hypothetical protein [Treponema sp.]
MEMLGLSEILQRPGLGAVVLILVAIIIIISQALKRDKPTENADNAVTTTTGAPARTDNASIIAAITTAVNAYRKSN